MKIVHLNFSDSAGGAARAAYRIHKSLSLQSIDSEIYVHRTSSGDWSVVAPLSRWQRALGMVRTVFAMIVRKLLKTGNSVAHSPSMLGSGWPRRLNRSGADIVHVHWTGYEMLSIRDLKRIRKPIVWTLHDMWAFNGAEHYAEDFRWRDGYLRTNRPDHESGFDLNRWVWHRKRRLWKKPLQLVTPSKWLAECVRQSRLLGRWPTEIILHPIDLDSWKPIPQTSARDLLGLPRNIPLVLFGADGGGNDPRKGFDLLVESLAHLRNQVPNLELVVFGEQTPKEPFEFGFRTHYVGALQDDLSLRALYSAANVFALPSRQDNLPLTAIEALACGVPVVAFDNTGLPTIIDHERNGYLAAAFDTTEFAAGIRWVLNQEQPSKLKKEIRKLAVAKFSPATISSQYRVLYEKVLARANQPKEDLASVS